MVSILTTICMILLLFISGHLIECIKRAIMLVINCFLKILNFFGVHIHSRESNIKVSRHFKDTFKEIKIVKKSKQNSKLKPSINGLALAIFLLSSILVIIDLDVVSNGMITQWLYNNTFLNIFITSQQHMDITFVAVMFSVISFSLSKLLNQWKETKINRKTKRQLKQHNRVFQLASSKELLDAAIIKDAEKYNQLKLKDEEK